MFRKLRIEVIANTMTYDQLSKKKKELDGRRPLPPALFAILMSGFRWN